VRAGTFAICAWQGNGTVVVLALLPRNRSLGILRGMPSVPDLTPEEIQAVLAARRSRMPVEDDLPASLTARLDREVAARVDAELAARVNGAQPQGIQVVKQKEKSTDGRVVGVMSLITGIPMLGIVEGTTHGSLAGAAIVMGGIVLVNMAHSLGRGRRKYLP